MKNNMLSVLILTIVISMLFSVSCFCMNDYGIENLRVKIGEIELTVELDSAYLNDFANASVYVVLPQVFSNFGDDDVQYLKKVEGKPGSYAGKIRTDVTSKFGVVVVDKNGYLLTARLALRQGKPLNLKMSPKNDPELPIEYKGVDEEDIVDINDGKPFLYTSHPMYQTTPLVPGTEYPGWNALVDYQQNTLWPSMVEAASKSCDIKPWVLNSMKMLFSSGWLLQHKETVKKFYKVEGEEPPVEAYTFLNEIDYSDIMLMQTPSYNMLRSFLNRFLALESFGIPAIGDTDIEEWREKAEVQLKKVIDKPTPLMLDLLSGVSYIRQLELDGKPLTEVQKRNIAAYYKDDIGKLVLEADSVLRASYGRELYDDKTSERINLEEYIAERFPGKPVVVDCWESWCGPCLKAIFELRERKLHEKYPDVVFLYVCSTSSEERGLRKYIPEIKGEHLKIDRETTGADMYDIYGREGSPFYIFFDRDHKVVDKMTGFPGVEHYESLLKQISSTVD